MNSPKKCFLSSIVNGIKTRNDEAFGKIYERYFSRVTNYLKRMQTFSKDQIDDLIQTVFLTLWQEICKGRTFESFYQLNGFLSLITKNKAADELRKRKVRKELQFGEEQEGEITLKDSVTDLSPLPDDNLYNEELKPILKDAILKLPEKQKEVVKLRYVGFDNNEIAKMLGDSDSQKIHQRFFDAKKTLRRLLKFLNFLPSFLIFNTFNKLLS